MNNEQLWALYYIGIIFVIWSRLSSPGRWLEWQNPRLGAISVLLRVYCVTNTGWIRCHKKRQICYDRHHGFGRHRYRGNTNGDSVQRLRHSGATSSDWFVWGKYKSGIICFCIIAFIFFPLGVVIDITSMPEVPILNSRAAAYHHMQCLLVHNYNASYNNKMGYF